ncbi:hypothetical protein [Roseococcus sp.]|uniref:hypothetical protein n=1 Tax=Roseococcus sp. TaxID=2109646 RepID=UPI003BA90843
MRRTAPLLLVAVLAGCAPTYSADEYAARAVQQANPVQQGVIAGSRRVSVAADGSTGATAGAAAGGAIGGAAVAGNSVSTALGAVGGALVGGLVGNAAERTSANTNAIEYIVRKNNDELISVTQRDAEPIPLGTRVLVISGAQARIVPDYTDSQTDPAPRTASTPRRPGSRPAPPATAAAEPVSGTAPLPEAPLPESLPDLTPAAPAIGELPPLAGTNIAPPPAAPPVTPATAPPAPLPAAASTPAEALTPIAGPMAPIAQP